MSRAIATMRTEQVLSAAPNVAYVGVATGICVKGVHGAIFACSEGELRKLYDACGATDTYDPAMATPVVMMHQGNVSLDDEL